MRQILILAFLIQLALLIGCFTPEKRIYQRSAIEKQTTTLAIKRAVEGLKLENQCLPPLVALKISTPDHTDDELVEYFLIKHLLNAGVQVIPESTEKILPVFEASVLFSGSDFEVVLVGIPIAVPVGVPLAADISVWKNETMWGRARIGVHLLNEEGTIIEDGLESEGEAYYSNFTILTFIGPFRWTDIEHYGP